jgi:hypothetical protein
LPFEPRARLSHTCKIVLTNVRRQWLGSQNERVWDLFSVGLAGPLLWRRFMNRLGVVASAISGNGRRVSQLIR